MILVVKTNSINQNNYSGMFTTSILRCMKKNKILVKTCHLLFKYLNFIFQIATNFKSNSSMCKWCKTNYYNNLAFEVHANKN